MSKPLKIEHLGARGDGVAHDDQGKAHYFPFTAPGDTVDTSGEILSRGKVYQKPACIHFGICGGCALQHVSDDIYADWLGDRITQALAQHDLVAQMEAPHISKPGTRRRAAFQARFVQGRLVLGYSIERSNDVIDLQECPVLDPWLFSLLTPLRRFLQKYLKAKAAARLELTRTNTGCDLLLDMVLDDGDLQTRAALSTLAEELHLARLSLKRGEGAADVIVQRRLPFLRFGDVPVILPPGAFLQATVEGEAALVNAVLKGVSGAKSVADLFCGVGTFTFPLSQSAKVHAVEGWKPALDAMNAAGATTRGIALTHRDLFRRPFSAKELAAFDAVVFDPPRAGAKAQAEQLALSEVPVIVAVSCNPNTFARDAAELVQGGYALEWVKPVGQFLWSREVELVARFVRKSK